jgi:3-deoxy-D-manno-octulosonic-acid transferase
VNDTSGALKPLSPPKPRLRVFFVVWQVFTHLMLPFALLFFLARSRREPLYRAHFSQRFGLGRVGRKGSVWVFATSLGETRAVSPLVRDLLAVGHSVCLTHSSPAGLIEGRRLFDDPRVTHRYVPFDFIWSTWAFLFRLRPCIGLVVEGEFWPGHLQVAGWLGIPMLHINGNLHENSLRRAERFWGLRMDILTRFNAILTKSEGHRDRYLRAGVSPERILIVGELKFDQWIDPKHLQDGQRLREVWSPDRPVFLIASSVAAEEEALLSIVERLLALPDPPRIIWVPRSPQRFGGVADMLDEKGISSVRRTAVLDQDRGGTIPVDADVLVGDSIGEMNVWTEMADLVFVGGTIADKGGHNISEPLALARPVVIGPSIYGITFPAIDADKDGAARILPDASAVSDEVAMLLTNPEALSQFTRNAESFAARHAGASARTLGIIDEYLEQKRDPKRWLS